MNSGVQFTLVSDIILQRDYPLASRTRDRTNRSRPVLRAMAGEADRAWDGDSVVLPALPVGVAPYHSRFPGTLSVSTETLRHYAHDVVKSLSDSMRSAGSGCAPSTNTPVTQANSRQPCYSTSVQTMSVSQLPVTPPHGTTQLTGASFASSPTSSARTAVGDATDASAEQGEAVFETAVDAILCYIRVVNSANSDRATELLPKTAY
nr:creatininase family protein [Natrinema amylolyticum]